MRSVAASPGHQMSLANVCQTSSEFALSFLHTEERRPLLPTRTNEVLQNEKQKSYKTGENMEKSSGDNRINIRAKWSTKIMSRRDSKPDHPTHNPGGTSDPRLLFQKAWHFGVKILVFSKPNSKFHLLVFPPCTFKKRVTTSGTRTRHNVTRSQGSCAGSRIKFESLARRAPHILGVRPCFACRCRSCFDSAGDPPAL